MKKTKFECVFCSKGTNYFDSRVGYVCAKCLGEYEAGQPYKPYPVPYYPNPYDPHYYPYWTSSLHYSTIAEIVFGNSPYEKLTTG